MRAVDGLRLMAEPESTVVCFTSDDSGLDLFVLADELDRRGWHTQPQLAYADLPASDPPDSRPPSVAPSVAEFGPDLVAAVAAARAAGPVRLPAGAAGRRRHPHPGALTAGAGRRPRRRPGHGRQTGRRRAPPVPDRMAEVNTLLNTAPPALREKLLLEFLSLLQQPTY